MVDPETLSEIQASHSPNNEPESVSTKVSFKKRLSLDGFETFDTSGAGNCIFDISLLSSAIKQFVECKFCDSTDTIELIVCCNDFENSGLVSSTKLECTACSEFHKFKTLK